MTDPTSGSEPYDPTSGPSYPTSSGGTPTSGGPYGTPGPYGQPYGQQPYGQQPGQQPYGQQPPPGFGGYPPKPVDDTKTWLMVAHFGGVAGVVIGGTVAGWLAPLIAYTTKGPTNPTVRAHAIEALNFHITWAIANVVALVIFFCGSAVTLGFGAIVLWIFPLATFVIAVAFGIVAGVKAANGEFYRYPMSAKLLK